METQPHISTLKPFAGQKFVLVAGGTGGHIFPAESLAHALIAMGAHVQLFTDTRGLNYTKRFPGTVHEIPSAPWSATPQGVLKLALSLAKGIMKSAQLLYKNKPSCVIGFGGYPSVPPVLLAQAMGISTMIHEQNAVLGRANGLLAKRAKVVALGLPIERLETYSWSTKAHLVGTPVRAAVAAQYAKPYPKRAPFDPLNIVVFGGSQGARVFANVLPPACGLLTLEERAQLQILHQVREEDLERTRQQYDAMGINVHLAPFFADLPARMADAHLVIGRAGASTVAELAALGRPSILVPLPGAVDQDQAGNAKVLQSAGAAIVVPQVQFTPEALATYMRQALSSPDSLAQMAACAHTQARMDAIERFCQIIKFMPSGK